MITTVTSATSGIMLSFTAKPALANLVAVIAVAMLIVLLIAREMVSPASTGWLQTLRQGATIAIYPLGLAFVAIVGAQLAHILS